VLTDKRPNYVAEVGILSSTVFYSICGQYKDLRACNNACGISSSLDSPFAWMYIYYH